jgi:cytochrome c
MTSWNRVMRHVAPLTVAGLLAACGSDQQGVARTPPDPGQMAFLRCEACHSIAPGEPHKLGPNLHGIVGRPAGTVEGFGRYTPALSNSGLVWERATLRAWLEGPARLVPGTSMVYHNTLSGMQLDALLDYLAANSPQ